MAAEKKAKTDQPDPDQAVPFRPRARIIRTLGRELISNERVALHELVKNSYDADATRCLVTFQPPLVVGKGAIVVEDDGVGMDLETVRTAWMEPATVSKVRRRQSKGGRAMTGEKGIGRFAAARIARILEIETMAKGSSKLVRARFDWSDFDDADKFLDELKYKLEEVPAPQGRRHGTVLRLLHLNDVWDEPKKQSFSRLRSEFSRLIVADPSADKRSGQFTVVLDLPKDKDLAPYDGPVTAPPILRNPRYRLQGHVDADGTIAATYAGPDEKAKLEGPDGTPLKLLLEDGNVPTCGPFHFEFNVWDRRPEDLQVLADKLDSTVADLTRDLNAACGINVYRDRFRVPLQEGDWLRLDLRRVNTPTLRLSNNQIVGTVRISKADNPELRDQSNRQGFVDNKEFEDFKDAIIGLLTHVESRRRKHRRAQPKQPTGESIFRKLDPEPLRNFVRTNYGHEPKLVEYVDEAAKRWQEGVGEVQTVLGRYRRLSTLGQIVDVILHEGRTPLGLIAGEVRTMENERRNLGEDQVVKNLSGHLDEIKEQVAFMDTLLERLSPFSGRKRAKVEELVVEDAIRDVFGIFAGELREKGIRTELPTSATKLRADPAGLRIVLTNLLDNARYWLLQVPAPKRAIKVTLNDRGRNVHVVFSDSGPGVAADDAEAIFEPYFSNKPKGVGLGLTIAGEAALESGGSLNLMEKGPLPGATFEIVLPKESGG